jgi:hypothetical protein
MSVSRWLCLLTKEEFEVAQTNHGYGESWFHGLIPLHPCFEFGDGRDENELGEPLSSDCYDLQDEPFAANTDRLKALYEQCSDFDEAKWDAIEQTASHSDRYIYFYSE